MDLRYKYNRFLGWDPPKSFGELSLKSKDAELLMTLMLERAQKYKEAGFNEVQDLLTALGHLNSLIQEAKQMMIQYQPLLEEFAAWYESQQKDDHDVCDSVSMISHTSYRSASSNYYHDKVQEKASIHKLKNNLRKVQRHTIPILKRR